MSDSDFVFGSFVPPQSASSNAATRAVTVNLPDTLTKEPERTPEKASTRPAAPSSNGSSEPAGASAPSTPAKPKARSWAALVSPNAAASPAASMTPSRSPAASSGGKGNTRAALAVDKVDLRAEPVGAGAGALPPVGLVNTGNFCYMNAVLQPVLRCGPLLRVLRQLADCPLPADAPILRALVELAADMQQTAPPHACVPAALAQQVAAHFAPARAPGAAAGASAQADAPEFLDWLLDRLHHDALRAAGTEGAKQQQQAQAQVQDADEQWSAVGRKQKTAVIVSDAGAREAASVVSACFGARVQSVVRRAGAAASMAVQPYLALPLDIAAPHVASVRDALGELLAREQLAGYEDRRAGATAASKQLSLASLPPVLVLLLKRYDPLTGAKAHKHVAFGRELLLQPEWLAAASLAPSPAARTYRLLAVVSHHGRAGTAGHYTADVLQADGRWLCFDDAYVSTVPETTVLQRAAYLLFYTRSAS